MYNDELNPGFTDLTDALAGGFDSFARGMGRYVRAWNEAVGPQVASHSVPTSISDGVLRVRCDSAVWTSELVHLQGEILPRLSGILKSDAPQSIKPYTGRIRVPAARQAPPTPEPLPPLSPAHIEALHRIASSISNDDLRARTIRAMVATQARSSGRESS